MHLWEPWWIFSDDRKLGIFKILTNHFDYKVYSNVTESKYQIVLFQGERDKIPLQKLRFDATLDNVLNVYKIFMEKAGLNHYEVLTQAEKGDKNISHFIQKESGTLLSHVKINIATGHPFVTCGTSQKHWRKCAGLYDITKQSYIRLFKRYCERYGKYPATSDHLKVFLNEFIYKRQNNIPEIFLPCMETDMDKVYEIFQEVMGRYSCEEYLKLAQTFSSEEKRLKYET